MTSQQVLGLMIIGGFLFVCVAEGVAILILSYKLGVCKGRLEHYEQPPAAAPQPVLAGLPEK